ncbi:MAG: hypothetical protein RR448_01175 [Niameybacter sp.]|uniref:hypothetical protein n=1 Tax=Niameybacter sp. TaxID=2033640 RepID=UPI002FCC80B9
MKKRRNQMIGLIGIVIGLIIINFIPTWSLKTKQMHKLTGDFVDVYYETDESGAKDVFELAEGESKRIARSLGFSSSQGINIYIYDSQKTLQTKKYGYITWFLGLDWYIGDNRGVNVLLTSPNNSGKAHDYDSVRNASVHEMVHAYNSVKNKKMPLWLDEGLAGYLSGQVAPDNLYSRSIFIPSLKQMHTSNPVAFNKMGGYEFSYTYVEYLKDAYGWKKVEELAEVLDYNQVLGVTEKTVYEGWIEFLKENYR